MENILAIPTRVGYSQVMTSNTQQIEAPRVAMRPARIDAEINGSTMFVEYVIDGKLRRCGHQHRDMDGAVRCAETKDCQHIARLVKSYEVVPQSVWDEINALFANSIVSA